MILKVLLATLVLLIVLFATLVLVLAHGLVGAVASLLRGPTKRARSRRRVRHINRIVARETAHLDRSYRDLCHRTDH